MAETAIESLAGYAYDDKHNGKHTDGKHDDLYPHGTKHAKHDKDATFAYQIVQTDRTFVYDHAGKLLSATETEDNYGTYVYTYEYDLIGNRTAVYKTDADGEIVESEEYSYNESNQVIKVALYDGKKNTTITYTYDEDGNRISETGKIGTDKVEKYYEYTVENRLAAVYDADELLMAAAYDGDGNRVFQLNYNLHTDEDWKGNSGNGNGSNKDNAGSGNSSSGDDTTEDTDASEDTGSTGDSDSTDSSGDSSSSNNGNGNNKNKSNNGNSGNSSANNGKGGNGKNNGNTKKNSTTTEETEESTTTEETTEAADAENDAETEADAIDSSTGNGNATNAEENNSQNQCGILFPIEEEVSKTEQSLIDLIKTTGKQKNYELIEYLNDVNREYVEVLVEQNINGKTDTSYVYGVERLSLDRFDDSTGYYLYDPRGSVTGITNEEGQIYQSYRYSVTGEITFGAPQYENEYTYNGESYNPNIESQYLRARYYCVVTATFLTEDSYLGDITEPLTLNRYNYCVSNPLNHVDPSGNIITPMVSKWVNKSVEALGPAVTEYVRKEWNPAEIAAIEEARSARKEAYMAEINASYETPFMQGVLEVESAIGLTGIYNLFISPLRYSAQGNAHPILETINNRQENSQYFYTRMSQRGYEVVDFIKHPEQFKVDVAEVISAINENPWILTPDLMGMALDAWDFIWESDDEEFYGASADGAIALTAAVAGEYASRYIGNCVKGFKNRLTKAEEVTPVRGSVDVVEEATESVVKSGSSTGTVWDKITPTQPMREGTQIPLSFNIDINGQEFWVAPNGTNICKNI